MTSRRALLLVPLLTLPGAAIAAEHQTGWNCRNADFEIACDVGRCQSSDTFTPMDVHLSAGKLTVAAYSGFWEGLATVTRDGPAIYAQSSSMIWSGDGAGEKAVFQLAVNSETLTGIILGAGFAHPMTCAPIESRN